MRYSGKIISFEFEVEDEFAHGGNGTVFNIRNIRKNDESAFYGSGAYVVKKFNVSKDDKFYNKKLIRFKEEIQFLTNVGPKIPGVVEVIDSCSNDETESYWYVMPKLSKYNYADNSFKNNIIKLIEIAKIIKNIHDISNELKYSHRDIKPANIMLKNGQPILCDFGLIWDDERETITGLTETIGPRLVLPPELIFHDLPDIDYRKSDVYLFAKLCWTYVRGRNVGFPGPYTRNGSYFLKTSQFCVDTIEPLNELLEVCTNDDINKRNDMGYCIKKLEDQLKVINKDLEPDKLKNYLNQEVVLNYTMSNIPIINEYSADMRNINSLFTNVKKDSTLTIKDASSASQFEFIFSKIFISDNLVVLNNNNGLGRYKKIYFNPDKIINDVNNKLLIVRCKKIDEALLPKTDNVDAVYVCGNYSEIVFKF